MIVVDTNIIIPFFIETPLSETVRQLARLEPDWAIPHLWQHEFLNVLAMHERRGLITMEECTAIWMNAREVVEPLEHEVNMIEALHFAAKGQISAYDAEYISCNDRRRRKRRTGSQGGRHRCGYGHHGN